MSKVDAIFRDAKRAKEMEQAELDEKLAQIDLLRAQAELTKAQAELTRHKVLEAEHNNMFLIRKPVDKK